MLYANMQQKDPPDHSNLRKVRMRRRRVGNRHGVETKLLKLVFTAYYLTVPSGKLGSECKLSV